MYRSISFEGFPGRKEGLQAIKRYSMFTVMLYRPTVFEHIDRVRWLVEDLAPFAEKVLKNFDIEKARTIAQVHDDAEMIFGDYQLGEKIHMTKEQLDKLDDEEADAVETLTSRSPETINGYNYREMMRHAIYKDCIEAQFVSFCDKFDGWGESCHDIWGGNHQMLGAFFVIQKAINEFPTKYPELAPLFDCDHVVFKPLEVPNIVEVQGNAKAHTEESFAQDTGFATYDYWKSVMIKNKGTSVLLDQRESF